jgi:hypothetical protein
MLGFSVLATLVFAAVGANAHATFQYLGINGVDQGTKCTRIPLNNNPVESVTSNDLVCQRNGAIPAASICAVKVRVSEPCVGFVPQLMIVTLLRLVTRCTPRCTSSPVRLAAQPLLSVETTTDRPSSIWLRSTTLRRPPHGPQAGSRWPRLVSCRGTVSFLTFVEPELIGPMQEPQRLGCGRLEHQLRQGQLQGSRRHRTRPVPHPCRGHCPPHRRLTWRCAGESMSLILRTTVC